MKQSNQSIGVLIDRMNVGGVEKIAIEEVKALRKLGVNASLVVLSRKAVVENAFSDILEDVPVIYLDDRLPRVLKLTFKFPVFNFFSLFHITYPVFLPFVVKKNEFNYLIVHGTYTCFTAISLKAFRKIPFSTFIWDPVSYILGRVYEAKFLKPLMWALKKIAYLIDRWVIRSTEVVLVGGSAHNRFIHSIEKSKSIETIYPSVHPLIRLKKKKGYVLMVTAWKRGKSPEYVFELAKQLPKIKIKMVGKWIDPSYQEEFEAMIKTHELTAQIEIVGAVSESQLTGLYAAADILLQTNDDRGFGMPAMEAAGSGTTFIIPEGQGVCELFTNGKEGYYTKEKDTKKIVSLLRAAHSDPKNTLNMGKLAWEKVKNEYSWENHAKKLMSVINRSGSTKI